jgi:hypothetical protein
MLNYVLATISRDGLCLYIIACYEYQAIDCG